MNKKKKYFIFLLLCLGWLWPTLGMAQSDTLRLSYEEYINNILRYHPIAKQAGLRLDFAKAEIQAAKGNFDPVITSDWDQKNFDDKLYYRHFQGRFSVPTLLGLDVVGGYENAEGVFLNPENTTDRYGLWNVGVEINVLQGLLVNERRTILEQAKVFQRIAKNQQQTILNDLLYEASRAYLMWQQYYHFQKVFEENQTIAATYFENTRQSYQSGEKTAMDTLEAFIILQDANTFLQSNNAALIKARQQLENFLWFNDLPLELQASTLPQDYEENIFQMEDNPDVSNLVLNHPLILEKINKLSFFEIEQKLKREKLKPKLKAKYNPLLSTGENGIAPTYSASDFKWGFDFSMPLFLRSERAGIRKGEVKLQETELDIVNKQNELLNKIQSNIQQQVAIRVQLNLQRENVNNYRQLLEGENEKFRYGESSVFLLNKRQEKYISGQLKLIELNTKWQTVILQYRYFSNTLIEN